MGSTHIRFPEEKKEELDQLKLKLERETGKPFSTADIFENVEMDELEDLVKDDATDLENTKGIFD